MSIGVSTPDEFKDRHRFSIGLLVYIFAVGVGFGAGVAMFNYALAEISGVRADMDKEDGHLQAEVERLDRKIDYMVEQLSSRIDRKIENHDLNKKAHKE